MRANPNPYTTYDPKLQSVPMTNVTLARAMDRIRKQALAYFGGHDLQLTTGQNHMVLMISIDTARQWLDGLVALKVADKRRKHKWVSDEPVVIGEWLWKDLNSPWNLFKIKTRAPVDDTIPAEGMMTEKELVIIYGTN